jgi:PDZ domain-containing secreted protein
LGDIIIEVNDQMIDVEADLFQALEDLQPGDVVEVKVNRVVAINDELQMKQVVLFIKLQPSTQLERSFGTSDMQQQHQPYRYSVPNR